MGSALYCSECDHSVDRDDLLICPHCNAVRPPFGWPEDSLLGHLVDAGRYRVEKRLGSGGFGVVYEVLHTLVNQSRAMKVMDQKLVGQADIQRRFIDEWDILDKLDHPHIVRCYEIGILPETKQPFMLLDLLKGHSIFEEIWPRSVVEPRLMAPARAARVGIQIASALGAAHKRGLLHRDLKPDNVLLVINDEGEEEVRVIDFGIAKILGNNTIDRKTSRIVGTPEYMAPEQFNPGQELDERLDLWQLGAVMFFIIAGWPPYSATDDDPLGVYKAMLRQQGLGPRPSSQLPLMKDYPGLDELVASLLATGLHDRPRSAQEVVKRLEELLRTELGGGRFDTHCTAPPAVAEPEKPKVQPPSMVTEQVRTLPSPHKIKQLGKETHGELRPIGATSAAKVPGRRRKSLKPPRETADAQMRLNGVRDTITIKPKTPDPFESKPERPSAEKTRDLEKQREIAREEISRRQKNRKLLFGGILGVLLLALVGVGATVVPWDEWMGEKKLERPRFVWIPSGTFDMGSPSDEIGRFTNETRHPVVITRPFFIQATEVTQGEWKRVMGSNPSSHKACGEGCPVDSVSWWDTLIYLNRRSVSDGLETCYELDNCSGIPGQSYKCKGVAFKGLACEGYRLPTEAEWEYAARAGTQDPFFNGSAREQGCSPVDDALGEIAWYCGNSGARPHPVGQKTPNEWGLFDTAGNVTEWVWDWNFGDYAKEKAKDPLGAKKGAGRTYRGGNWSNFAADCRVGSRSYGTPEHRSADLGFRPVRTAY